MTREDLYNNRLKTLKGMLRRATDVAPLQADKITSVFGVTNDDVGAMINDLKSSGIPVKSAGCGHWL